MPHSITLKLSHNISAPLTVIEKSVWYETNGGEWSEENGPLTFTMTGERGSGLIRFRESNGQIFSVVIGYGYRGTWADVQTNLDDTDTGVKLLPEYYRSGGRFSTESHKEITRYTSAGKTVKLDISEMYDQWGGADAVLEYS